jgi:hypothetical protein
MLIILVDFYDVYMCTNSNYLGPFRNRFPLKFVPETSIGQFFIIKPIRNCI